MPPDAAPDTPLRVAPQERGVVRVFNAPGSAPEWAGSGAAGWPLPGLLGLETLNAADVQAFEMADLAPMSLRDFLADAYDISPDQLDAAALDPVRGTVAVLRSGAFPETPALLSPAPGIALVGVFHEPAARKTLADMGDYESARPRATPAAPPRDEKEPEDDGARVVASFRPSREAYIRSHLWLGAAAMGIATAILYWMGNPDYWVGAVAGPLAIAVRGFYLASEELGRRWDLTETSVRAVTDQGLVARVVPLRDVARVRRLGSAVQLVTGSGDKLLMKYIGDPEAVQQRIASAAGVPLE